MSFEFKPEDFKSIEPAIGQVYPTPEQLTQYCNAKLDEWKKSWVRVHGIPSIIKSHHNWTEYDIIGKTHQAYIVEIEELKPKECEHAPSMHRWHGKEWELSTDKDGDIYCSSCMKKLNPRAKWKIK